MTAQGQQINLRPEPEVRPAQGLTALRAVQVLGGFVVLLVLYGGVIVWQVGRLAEERASLEAENARLSARLQQLGDADPQDMTGGSQDEPVSPQRLKSEKALMQHLVAALRGSVRQDFRGYSGMLKALARRHVAGLWLTELDISGAGEAMRFAGRSIDAALVPRYIQALDADPGLEGLTFQTFRLARVAGRRRDEVEFLVATHLVTAEEVQPGGP